MTDNERQTRNAVVSWLALILAILSLVISGAAFQKIANFKTDAIKTQFEDISTQQRAIQSALGKLSQLRTGLASGTTKLSDAAGQITPIREDLKTAFMNASLEAKASWTVIDEGLGQLTKNLKGGTSAALNLLDSLILSLKRLVQ